MVRRSLIALGVSALAVPLVGIGGLGSAGAAPFMVRLSGTSVVLPQAAVATSAPVAKTEQVRVRLQLRLRDQAGADALALAVSTPGSAQYRQYLTPDQFRARFAPTQGAVDKASAWLASQGLSVTNVPKNRFWVDAQGTAGQVEAAFGTSLATVQDRGGQRRVNTIDAAIPASLADSVEGVTGLTEVFMKPTHVGAGDEVAGTATSAAAEASASTGPDAPPSPGFRNAPPCSSFWAEKLATGLPNLGSGYANPLPWAPCGWKPGQLRSAYGTESSVVSGIDGRGVTVAIVDAYASQTIFEDASTYAQRNDPSHPLDRSQFRQNNFRPETRQKECDIQGWYGEETLDVEAIHAMAPGASILYSGARSCDDLDIDEALGSIVDDHTADIVNNSYGNPDEVLLPPAVINSSLRIHTQAAIEGIGIFFSSGDGGDESDTGTGGPTPAADFPASSKLVTAVGGTSLGIDANGNVAIERGWTTGVSNLDPATNKWVPGGRGAFLYGAGGGPSRLFDQPDYQKGVVPNSIARGIGAPKRRVVPDVGMDGDPNTGFLVGQTQTFPEGVSYDEFRLGGTSLSSPLFAGVMALADQAAGYHHGFANPFLYSLAGSSAFRDIKPGPKAAVIRRNYVNSTDSSAGITPPSARTIDADLQSLRTLRGYDTLTGLGAPNGADFVNAG